MGMLLNEFGLIHQFVCFYETKDSARLMKNTVSLKENRIFRQLYGKGKKEFSSLFVVYCRENRTEQNRLGITVSKKIGNSVQRNRAKRIIREGYRLSEEKIKTGYDLVFVARTKTVEATTADVIGCLYTVLKKMDLLVH